MNRQLQLGHITALVTFLGDGLVSSGETSTLGQGGQIAVVGARVKTVKQGFSNFWCYGAHEEIDHNLRSPTINF